MDVWPLPDRAERIAGQFPVEVRAGDLGHPSPGRQPFRIVHGMPGMEEANVCGVPGRYDLSDDMGHAVRGRGQALLQPCERGMRVRPSLGHVHNPYLASPAAVHT